MGTFYLSFACFTSQVLFLFKGPSSLESRHYILPLVRSTSLCTSSILDVYKSSGEGRSGPSRVSTVSAFFFGCGGHGSPSCFLLVGLPRRLPCHLVLFTQPLFLLSHLRIETLLLSVAVLSLQSL